MLIAFDIGNTNTVLGVFQDGSLVESWRMETDARKSADEYGMIVKQFFLSSGLKMEEIDDVIIATVVPSVLYTIRHMARKYFRRDPIVVESGIKTGLIIKYDNPKQVGADRIVNAVAAHQKYPGDLIVIDLGTATTFCAVSAEGEYLGGTIAPGLKISSTALFEMTAQLPKVELEAPGRTICRNTISGMQSGLVYGHMGMVEFIVRKMQIEMLEITGRTEPPKVIATGGLSNMIRDGVNCIDVVDRNLTLDGLNIIYQKNRRHARRLPPKKLEEEPMV